MRLLPAVLILTCAACVTSAQDDPEATIEDDSTLEEPGPAPAPVQPLALHGNLHERFVYVAPEQAENMERLGLAHCFYHDVAHVR